MSIARCTKSDFDQILDSLGEFWDSDSVRLLHHPMFLYEFGNTALVVRREEQVVAYLLGFFAQTRPSGYVHLVAVRRSHRRRGMARLLYEQFIEDCRSAGLRELKAITSRTNEGSIRFHRSLGMELIGDASDGSDPYIADYSGPGLDRIVFRMDL